MTVTVSKDAHGGWRAEDEYPMEGNRVLILSTLKIHSGEVVTQARSVLKTEFGHTYMPFDDFHVIYERKRYPRATSKVVAEQHGRSQANAKHITAQAIEYYKLKEKVS